MPTNPRNIKLDILRHRRKEIREILRCSCARKNVWRKTRNVNEERSRERKRERVWEYGSENEIRILWKLSWCTTSVLYFFLIKALTYTHTLKHILTMIITHNVCSHAQSDSTLQTPLGCIRIIKNRQRIGWLDWSVIHVINNIPYSCNLLILIGRVNNNR